MEIKDFEIIISTSIIVIGWFVNNWLNRKHEIAKKRIEYRLKTLHSFIPVYTSLTNNNSQTIEQINKDLKDSYLNIQLYGEKDEIKLFTEFKDALDKKTNENNILAIKYMNKLMGIIKKRIRKELGLSKII